MSMISFVGFNIISGWYQDKRFVGFLLPTSLFLFWTKKTLKWEIALGESRTALRTALSHMLFQTFGEGRNYSFGWDWNFLFEKEIFLVYTLIRIPKTRIQVQSNKDNIFNRKSARSQFSKSPTTTSWRISNHWNYIVRMTQRVIKKLDWSGIRTHAPEEIGALIQRLRPLGHPVLGGLHNLQAVFCLINSEIL